MTQYLPAKIVGVFSLGLFFHIQADGRLISPIPSSVPGVTIPNTHALNPTTAPGLTTQIYRGMAPLTRDQMTQELWEHLGITDVLNLDFDNLWDTDRSDNPDNELAMASDAGYIYRQDQAPPTDRFNFGKRHYYRIPFPYDNLKAFPVECQNTMRALRVIKSTVSDPLRKIFFHCTVGEDRTGMLAGLLRLLIDKWKLEDTFYSEMCEYGYEAGDPEKAKNAMKEVVIPIRESLTPFFLKMAYKIETGALNWDHLSEDACATDPANDDAFTNAPNGHYDATKYICTTSTLVPASN